MPLTGSYVLANSRIPEVFSKVRDGQAPDQVTRQILKDWGFSSSNDRAFIPLLKTLGFLSPTGQPTERYHIYRDHSQSKRVMGEALRDAYRDLFNISDNPKESDREAIEGKFKSYHNVSDNAARNMAATFFALLKIADVTGKQTKQPVPNKDPSDDSTSMERPNRRDHHKQSPTFHYNIQVHLPATKDTEVYNAIFKSMRDHFVDI